MNTVSRRDFCAGLVSASLASTIRKSDAQARLPNEVVYEGPNGERLAYQPVDVSKISDLATVPQCLDNQWTPTNHLFTATRAGISRTQILGSFANSIRAEYIRSLINSEQVIINRAFFRNSPSVYQDYVDLRKEGESFDQNRDTFKRMLSGGAIIPFLRREKSPIHPVEFQTSEIGDSGWYKLNREVAPKCLRLSWDDETNLVMTRRLHLSYHNFASTIKNSAGSLLDALWTQIGRTAAAEDYRSFVKALTDVSRFADDLQAEGGFTDKGQPKSFITREAVYKKYVLETDTPVVEGKFDKNKAFSSEIKLIFDLKYATNLSDFLGVHAITPTDSPSQDVFAEFEIKQIKAQSESSLSSPEELKRNLVELKRRLAQSTIQQALTFRNFADFDMATVEATRLSSEWAEYISSLRAVIRDPEQVFNEGSGFDRVQRSYAGVLTYASRYNARRRSVQVSEAWAPHLSLALTIGGTVVSFFFTGGTGPVLFRAVKVTAPVVAGQAAPFLCRLAVGGVIERQAEQNLESGLIFLRRRIGEAEERAEELLRFLEQDPTNFKALRPAPGPLSVVDATLNDTVDVSYVP